MAVHHFERDVVAKAKTVYRCTECGAEFPKWAGRCESCDAWNTLGEELVSTAPTSKPRCRHAIAGATVRADDQQIVTHGGFLMVVRDVRLGSQSASQHGHG